MLKSQITKFVDVFPGILGELREQLKADMEIAERNVEINRAAMQAAQDELDQKTWLYADCFALEKKARELAEHLVKKMNGEHKPDELDNEPEEPIR